MRERVHERSDRSVDRSVGRSRSRSRSRMPHCTLRCTLAAHSRRRDANERESRVIDQRGKGGKPRNAATAKHVVEPVRQNHVFRKNQTRNRWMKRGNMPLRDLATVVGRRPTEIRHLIYSSDRDRSRRPTFLRYLSRIASFRVENYEEATWDSG